MKKYVIKNADGSEQSVMEAVHLSRKDAGQALCNYLREHNDYGGLDSDDENWASPFDFIIKEVECKDVSEVITDFESARKALGLKQNDALSVVNSFIERCAINSKNAARLVRNISKKNIEALIALGELLTISEAWNKEDGFVPDLWNKNQSKWCPWFQYADDNSKLIYDEVYYVPKVGFENAYTLFSFKSRKRAELFGKQFIDLYNKVFL